MILERELFKEINSYIEASEAIIVTGMRRTGKTTLLQYIYDGINSSNKILLDLENPINRRYFEEFDYERIKTSLEVLGLDFRKKPYIFLDEIQMAKNIPSVVKYFIDHHEVKFFLTGSASYYLKNLFSESLVGRKYIFELFPLTFREFIIFKGSKVQLPKSNVDIPQPIFENISRFYDEYISFGGFPEVVLKESFNDKKRALEDIFTSYYQMEVMQLRDYRKNVAIRDLMVLLMQRVGSKLDISKLSRELGISRQSVNEYVTFLEGTYFIKTIRPLSTSKDTEIRKTPKVYLCDSGLANNFANLSQGNIFENNVFQNLNAKGELNYYQRKRGVEIDFILNKQIAYEVKITPDRSDLMKLERISKELGLKEYKLISKNYSAIDNVIFGFLI